MQKGIKSGDIYKFSWNHNKKDGPCIESVLLEDWKMSFLIKSEVEYCIDDGNQIKIGIVITVNPEFSNIHYSALVDINEESDELSHLKLKTKIYFDVNSSFPKKCKIQFKITSDVGPNILVGSFIYDHLKYILSKSSTVTIVGSDGSVEVKKKILKIRSPVFRAMFEHNTKEKDSLQIEMAEFDKETLDAFVKFITTDAIDDDSDHAIDLFVLGDKYDIPLLKSRAEQILMSNLSVENKSDVYDVLIKIKPDAIKEFWLKNYPVKAAIVEDDCCMELLDSLDEDNMEPVD